MLVSYPLSEALLVAQSEEASELSFPVLLCWCVAFPGTLGRKRALLRPHSGIIITAIRCGRRHRVVADDG